MPINTKQILFIVVISSFTFSSCYMFRPQRDYLKAYRRFLRPLDHRLPIRNDADWNNLIHYKQGHSMPKLKTKNHQPTTGEVLHGI